MANTFKVEFYKSAKSLSYFVIGLLLLQIGCMILSTGFGFCLLLFPDRVLELDNGDNMPIFFTLIGLIAIPEILFRIAGIVMFLIWEHRSFGNLSPLKARNLEFSPGWAVGWWFIPFANLVKPYQAVKELWRESDPDFEPEMGFLSSSVGVPSLFGFWWALWILTNISGRILYKLSDGKMSDIITVFPVLLIASQIAAIAAAGLLIWIVRDVTARQEERFLKISPYNKGFGSRPPFDQNV